MGACTGSTALHLTEEQISDLVFAGNGAGPLGAEIGTPKQAELWEYDTKAATTADLTRRRAMVATVLRLVAEDLPYIPLYRRTITWAMQKKVSAVQWPNDTMELRWVRVR